MAEEHLFSSTRRISEGLALRRGFLDQACAGIVTLYEAPYRPGDWVEIKGVYGVVKSMNLRCAKLVTPEDRMVIIPHLTVWHQLLDNANDGGQNLQLQQPINVIVTEKPWAAHYRLKAYPIEPGQQSNFITDLTIRGRVVLAKAGVEYVASLAMTAGERGGLTVRIQLPV